MIYIQREMKGRVKSESRYLLRHGGRKNLDKGYVDVVGNYYDSRLAARLSSFLAIMAGCMRNGFPVVRRHMRYAGWAFWPFFFIHARTDEAAVKATINHERIHIRQQWDIHRLVSFPLLIVLAFVEITGGSVPLLAYFVLPFVPTIMYGVDMLRVLIFWKKSRGRITFMGLREGTCYETECRMHQLNDEYLKDRKFLAVLKHIGR